MSDWLETTDSPGDGDSIWIAVMEWDGVNVHVEYAQTFLDVDGLLIHRYEGERDGYGEKWPPQDVLAWKECDVPQFVPLCPFCNTRISTELCCTGMIAVKAFIENEAEK